MTITLTKVVPSAEVVASPGYQKPLSADQVSMSSVGACHDEG
jgi:hypothetical protein